MVPKAGYSTPMLHVADIERSIRFYELLGFETVDTDRGEPRLGWARLHCEGGAIMLFLAEADHPPAQPTLSYMYTPDLSNLREHLSANGVTVSEIHRPEYMPSGEITLHDPDGNLVFVAHWGDKEHAEWLKRIGKA